MATDRLGIVYLIHFSRPLEHARHYLGFCEFGNLLARLEAHRTGNGSKLMAAVKKAGIRWRLVRTWVGDRNFERSLKNRHDTLCLCPVCRRARLAKKARSQRARRAAA